MINRLLSLIGLKRIDDSHALAKMITAGYETDTGVSVTTKTALENPAVYTCVRILTNSVGMLPVAAYEKLNNARNEISNFRIHRLVSISPNEYQTAQEFWEMCVMHLALRGNFYAWKNVVNGELRELLPLNPAGVTPKWTDDRQIVYEVDFENGATNVYRTDEVFHVKLPSYDGLTGLSPIGWQRETIGLSIALQKHGARVFKNGTRLSGVLHTPEVIGDEGYKRIKESWDETYAGVENANKVAILEHGLQFQGLSMSNEDAQFLESRKYTATEIYGIYGVPPHLAGNLDRATFSNIEHQGQEFVVYALMPYLTRIESRVRFSLIEKKHQAKRYIKFNVGALVRGDMKARGEFYTRMIQNGAMSPNEIRALEEMNPRDGGDIYLTPINMAIDGKPVGDNAGEKGNDDTNQRLTAEG
ncbi:MAG: phage portal protein [Candidatus Thiodiazotropha sp. (ex Epidulcina cf. delphinae)]|nr:phage portal protein [Candidatus Thiodiazotropha sp. (ex Epidulcina cf. delphinae)]